MSAFHDDRFESDNRPTQAALDEAETNLSRIEELGEYLRDAARLVARELEGMGALDVHNYPPVGSNSAPEVIEGAAEEVDALFKKLVKRAAVRDWKQTLEQADV